MRSARKARPETRFYPPAPSRVWARHLTRYRGICGLAIIHAMSARAEASKGVLDILTVLEFGTRKEERELLDGVFEALGVQRRHKKESVAEAILGAAGFEPFLLEVLKAVRPFALMLRDLYTFLNRAEAITRR